MFMDCFGVHTRLESLNCRVSCFAYRLKRLFDDGGGFTFDDGSGEITEITCAPITGKDIDNDGSMGRQGAMAHFVGVRTLLATRDDGVERQPTKIPDRAVDDGPKTFTGQDVIVPEYPVVPVVDLGLPKDVDGSGQTGFRHLLGRLDVFDFPLGLKDSFRKKGGIMLGPDVDAISLQPGSKTERKVERDLPAKHLEAFTDCVDKMVWTISMAAACKLFRRHDGGGYGSILDAALDAAVFKGTDDEVSLVANTEPETGVGSEYLCDVAQIGTGLCRVINEAGDVSVWH